VGIPRSVALHCQAQIAFWKISPVKRGVKKSSAENPNRRGDDAIQRSRLIKGARERGYVVRKDKCHRGAEEVDWR